MKNKKGLFGKTGLLVTALLLCFGMTAMAAPAVEGDTELTAEEGEIVSAEYTVTNDEAMENVKLSLTYDRDVLTYMSGSGGNNFSGSGGNGLVELSSNPDSTEATFSVRFRGLSDEDTTLEIRSCTITVDGEEINALTGVSVSEEEAESESEEGEDEDGERASWVIDDRTFYLHNPGSLDGFEGMRMDIQGISSRVLYSESMDLYVIMLFSDNGSYRDHFVYNPDTGNVVPFVQKESGTDTVVFVEPEEGEYVPTRYSSVEMPWGAKYTIPAYKHVIIDGIDEIFDDTNRYLVYGVNQDGEKAWYSYDYDKDSLQLFDDVAYQGEQNYISELEEQDEALRDASNYSKAQYDANMGRRLMVILVLTLIIIVLINALVFTNLRLRRLREADADEEDEPEQTSAEAETGEYITGTLEENETDFREPGQEREEPELEIIDLDDPEDEEN
ncbi:MAG: hypothetical protein Q4C82_01140 [Eubacteriales bacterium]|nr:hypothetical protein [Eubacteriales bacterium]